MDAHHASLGRRTVSILPIFVSLSTLHVFSVFVNWHSYVEFLYCFGSWQRFVKRERRRDWSKLLPDQIWALPRNQMVCYCWFIWNCYWDCWLFTLFLSIGTETSGIRKSESGNRFSEVGFSCHFSALAWCLGVRNFFRILNFLRHFFWSLDIDS